MLTLPGPAAPVPCPPARPPRWAEACARPPPLATENLPACNRLHGRCLARPQKPPQWLEPDRRACSPPAQSTLSSWAGSGPARLPNAKVRYRKDHEPRARLGYAVLLWPPIGPLLAEFAPVQTTPCTAFWSPKPNFRGINTIPPSRSRSDDNPQCGCRRPPSMSVIYQAVAEEALAATSHNVNPHRKSRWSAPAPGGGQAAASRDPTEA